jgi:spore coat-associated protein N
MGRSTFGALLVALWAITVAIGSTVELERPRTETIAPRLTAAGGNGVGNSSNPVSISNSRAGVAVLTAANMKPGSTATGTVTVTNTGAVDSDLSLDRQNLRDLGSPTMKLSAALDLVVRDLGGAGRAASDVYSGKLGAMPALALGTYAKNEARSYRFTVSYPASSGSGFQGTSASVDYVWTLVKSTGGGPKK